MRQIKDTRRALVRIGYDGRVHKVFRGHEARERFTNECRVLKYLQEQGCDFVPKVLEADPETLTLVTTNCGQKVESLSLAKLGHLFAELEAFGVRHEDRADRNVTYSVHLGRFCVIDFEYATLLNEEGHVSPMPWNPKGGDS